jgi:NIMA (never in mitosis gene a)-related kinase 1/4/5
MEYCNRGDLSIFIKGQMGKPIKEEIIWKFSIQMMVGLHDLHSKKILHRDIKALNIFLDSN